MTQISSRCLNVPTWKPHICQLGVLLNCLPLLKFIPGDAFKTKILQKNYTTFARNFDKYVLEDIKMTSGQDESFLHVYAAKIQQEAEVISPYSVLNK